MLEGCAHVDEPMDPMGQPLPTTSVRALGQNLEGASGWQPRHSNSCQIQCHRRIYQRRHSVLHRKSAQHLHLPKLAHHHLSTHGQSQTSALTFSASSNISTGVFYPYETRWAGKIDNVISPLYRKFSKEILEVES